MTHRAVLLLLVPACAVTIPASGSEDKKPLLYFPTTVGSRWEYESDGFVRVEVVTAVKETKEGKHVDVGIEFDGKVTQSGRLVVSEQGLCVVSGRGAIDLKEPVWLLKLPHKEGNKWDTVIDIAPGKWGGVSKATGPEEVKVPAGTYQAIVVRYEGNAPGQDHVVTTRWYAPDVGKVKELYDKKLTVLKRFTPGK